MKPISWWLWHDRIGRSRLVIIAIAMVLVITWAVFRWPSLVGAVAAVVGSFVLAVADYFFWRSDARKAEKPEIESD